MVNVGSATVKAARIEVGPRGTRTRSRHTVSASGGDRAAGVREALERIGAAEDSVDAVGHRVVHGGFEFREPVRIDARVEARIEALSRLAPLHNPPALDGIRGAREALPGKPMVAVFDTAFHAGRPEASLRYALPPELAEERGIVRYGFHGIAHAALLEKVARAQGGDPEGTSAVTLQLGAGCSACAIAEGRPVETSMGFSPLEGLPMATRSGDVDPAAVLHLLREGHDVDAVEDLLLRRSGLLGMGGSADLRELLRAEAGGDARAAGAVALFVRRIVLTVGAYLTLLGGRGALVFGGGIGRGSAEIRRRVALGLSAWEVALDPDRNAAGEGRVSAADARPVYAFDSDEEPLIARDAARALASDPS